MHKFLHTIIWSHIFVCLINVNNSMKYGYHTIRIRNSEIFRTKYICRNMIKVFGERA